MCLSRFGVDLEPFPQSMDLEANARFVSLQDSVIQVIMWIPKQQMTIMDTLYTRNSDTVIVFQEGTECTTSTIDYHQIHNLTTSIAGPRIQCGGHVPAYIQYVMLSQIGIFRGVEMSTMIAVQW